MNRIPKLDKQILPKVTNNFIVQWIRYLPIFVQFHAMIDLQLTLHTFQCKPIVE